MKNIGILLDCGFKEWAEFGYEKTLYSWFSTICYRLEDGGWGSKYPLIMNNFYCDEDNGVLYDMIDAFEKEIKEVERIFSIMDSSNAIWSHEDKIYKVPLDIPNINYNAKTLREFYINNRKKTSSNF